MKRKKQLTPKEKRIKEKHIFMEERSIELNIDLPKSEVWFHSIYKSKFESTHNLELYQDKYNYNFNDKFIPDVINKGYKYIIEIDGKIHEKEIVKIKDERKNEYFESRGYEVIRVKYPDLEESLKALMRVLEIRKDPKHPLPNQGKRKSKIDFDLEWLTKYNPNDDWK